MTGRHTPLRSVLLGALLIGAVVAPAGATQTDEASEPSMTVDLAADGDARVTLVSTFDLDDDSKRAAFDGLRTNETARSVYEARYTDRLRTVVNDTESLTGREMAVTNSSLALSRTDSTGVATFSLTWEHLAAAEDGMLTLDEPFASGFDRRLVVVLPERYQLESVSPGPTNSSDGRLVYAADAELDGLSVVASSTVSSTSTPARSPTLTPVGTSGGNGPGFGVAGALIALAAAGLLAGRRG